MTAHRDFPRGGYTLANARLPFALARGIPYRAPSAETGLALADLVVAPDGRLAAGPGEGPVLDLDGRIVLPCFIDSHTHLDKAFTVRRTGLPSSFSRAVLLSLADAANRTEADLTERMERGLDRAFLHGTAALRTHLDTPTLPEDSAAWRVFDRLRARWAGRMTLQGVALMALGRVEDADFAERCAQIAALKGVLGAFVAPGTASPARLDTLFEHAARAGLDVDFHVDETLDPTADGLELIAQSVLRTGFAGRVLAGHCCALATKPADERARIIETVARAGLHVVALPHSNMFLQDRSLHATPVRRGITAVHELRAQGVPVHFASDNVQDAFFAYGDFDMLEVLRSAIRTAHLDASSDWLPAFFQAPGRALGLESFGALRAGAPADLVVFPARDAIDLMSRPQADRLVLRAGAALPAAAAPGPRDLFTLELP